MIGNYSSVFVEQDRVRCKDSSCKDSKRWRTSMGSDMPAVVERTNSERESGGGMSCYRQLEQASSPQVASSPFDPSFGGSCIEIRPSWKSRVKQKETLSQCWACTSAKSSPMTVAGPEFVP